MVDFDVGVVLPTAGSSERIGGSNPKQYTRIAGKALFLYALEGFISLKFIKKICLVVDNIEKAKNIVQESGLTGTQKVIYVLGGSTRHRSIKAGLQELKKHKECWGAVVVHDGVRPIVEAELVEAVVEAAVSAGAAGATRPLVSTVIKPSQRGDSLLEATLPRSLYAASETPQAFRMDVISKAYDECTDEDLEFGTECLELVLAHCGIRAALVQGPPSLWKVTHKRDLHTAAAAIAEHNTDVCIMCDAETAGVRVVAAALAERVSSVEVMAGPRPDHPTATFNTVILFHVHEIHQDHHLLDFASLLDLEKQGLIIHVIDHASVDGLQSMSVYNLHKNSCKMAHNYVKLRKGVVVIHCVSSNETQRLVDIVTTLVLSDPLIFSGQTLFL